MWDYKGLAPWLQPRTTLNDCLSFRIPEAFVGNDKPSLTSLAAKLLPIVSVLPQVLTPRVLSHKSPACQSLCQNLLPGESNLQQLEVKSLLKGLSCGELRMEVIGLKLRVLELACEVKCKNDQK